MAEADGRSFLLVGGGGGLLGRCSSTNSDPSGRSRSVHRHRATTELRDGVEWLPGDIGTIDRWEVVVQGIDLAIDVAWYRYGSHRRFEPLTSGLWRLLAAAVRERVPCFLQVSIPPLPSDWSVRFAIPSRRGHRRSRRFVGRTAPVDPRPFFHPSNPRRPLSGHEGATEKARHPDISNAHHSYTYEKSTRHVESPFGRGQSVVRDGSNNEKFIPRIRT